MKRSRNTSTAVTSDDDNEPEQNEDEEEEEEEDEEDEEDADEEEENMITSKHADTLQRLFQNAYDKYKTGNPERVNIEVEARLGQQLGKKFQPGVTRTEFELLRDYFDHNDNFSLYQTEEIDYIFPSPGDQKGSFKVNFDGDKAASGQIKSKVESMLLKLEQMSYDVKVGISQEIECTPTGKMAKQDCRMIRRKDRWTYEDDGLLKVDLTIVSSSRPKKSHLRGEQNDEFMGKTIYEVEFELLSLEKFSDVTERDNSAEKFYSVLMSALNVLNRGSSENLEASPSPFPEDLPFSQVDPQELPTLKTNFLNAMKLPHCTDFPGSMPVTFSRRHFHLIQNTDYMVSEKTDGHRYMLLVCSSGAFLIDRKFFFYRLDNCTGLVALFSQGDTVTLLDGELVRHLKDGNIVYLLFDVVQINGEYFGDRSLKHRLESIGKSVVQPYREEIGKKDSMLIFPFTLCGKKFMLKRDIRSLFNLIKEEPDGSRCFSDGTRNHKTDGIIFTPTDPPYGLHTCTNLFKWKFLDKQTVDFRAKRVGNSSEEFDLFIGIKGGETKAFNVVFSAEDASRLATDFAHHNRNDEAIIECGYDRLHGLWKYVTIRPDKTKPNFVRVMLETLFAIAEAVTKEEVIVHVSPAQQPGPPVAGISNGNQAKAHHAPPRHGGGRPTEKRS